MNRTLATTNTPAPLVVSRTAADYPGPPVYDRLGAGIAGTA